MKRLGVSAALMFVFASALFCASAQHAFAATTDNVSGYAWSSTIGWISFNCTNDSSCATSNYGVNLDGSNNLVGYAWSSNIGWIQFGGLAGFPTESGTQSTNAQVNGNNVKGWARALSNGGGWDGWISLAGAGPSYGATLSGSNFSGYAWGGDVVGWISFNCTNDSSCATSNYAVTLAGSASLDVKSGGVSIVNNNAVPYGTVPTFEWTLNSLPGGATCSVSKTSGGGTAFSTVSGINSSGSIAGSALTNGAYTFQISCTSGQTQTVSFTVAPQPAGFTLGGTETLAIKILPSGTADSAVKSVFVTAQGGFTNPVSVSISSFPTAPASTTFQYSFNSGSTYSSNPGTTVISSPYSSGIGFRMRVTRSTGAGTMAGTYTVTLHGTGSGVSDAYKDIILTPATSTQVYQEI